MATKEYLTRTQRAWEELHRLAPLAARGSRTDPDPQTGEQWDSGQILAHVAELLPYWVVQIRGLIALGGRRPFGRTSIDGARAAAIEGHRQEPLDTLLPRIEAGITDVQQLLNSLDEQAMAVVGIHSTIGEMTVERILERLIIGHLEEHVEQIRSLASARR